MLTIKINGNAHYLPDGWHELPFSRVEDVLGVDILHGLCGIPIELAATFDDQTQNAIATRLAAFKNWPKTIMPAIDIGSLPFGQYVKLCDAGANRLEFLRVHYGEVVDNCQWAIPRWTALTTAWDAFHNNWAWLKSQPSGDWAAAGIGKLDKYGIYSMVAELAHGDILKEEQLMTLETSHVFMHRAYHKDKAEVEANFTKLATKPKK